MLVLGLVLALGVSVRGWLALVLGLAVSYNALSLATAKLMNSIF